MAERFQKQPDGNELYSMNTPFTFFRRNSQVMLVAVVIISMMAFPLDLLFSDRGLHFLLLGLLLGAMLLSFFGISSGQ